MTTTARRPLDRAAALASPAVLIPLEAAAVLASPLVLYVLFRLRGMAPVQLPDPSMHTTFIVDPHDIFARYQAVFTPTSRLREAARVGFLVPARISYLLFGLVNGFFILRYVFTLITIVPAYLLLRRLYGRWAGWLAIVVLMGSPVLVTAWGTDYPDSAVVSYLTGALAALALAVQGTRVNRGWLTFAGVLLTLAVWSHGIAVPLVGGAVVVYLAFRYIRARAAAARDLLLLAGVAILTTLLLAVGSKLLIGQFNFITPTVRAEQYLSTPGQEALWHSSSWSWAPYDLYLLVPPAVVAALFVVLAGTWRRKGSTPLFVLVAGTVQLVVFAYLQFFGSVQALEMHYMSSTLWSSVNLMLIILVAELARPLLKSKVLRWTPALAVLAVVLVYDAVNPAASARTSTVQGIVPAMKWAPWGFVLLAIVVAGALIGRYAIVLVRGSGRPAVMGSQALALFAIFATSVALLVLTVSPPVPHKVFPHTIYDPPPAYAAALGGSDAAYVDQYVVSASLPAFVGHPAYRNEQLLTWWPPADGVSGAIIEPMGIFHSWFNLVSHTFPELGAAGLAQIESRHISQVLIMATNDSQFPAAVRSLRRFDPVVERRGLLAHGSYFLYTWLIDLKRYLHAS